MSDLNDQPPAKRVKLDEEEEEVAVEPTTTIDNSTNKSIATFKTVAQYEVPKQFSFEEEEGLFGLVYPSLGRRAATEDETGILEYVDGTIPSFSGIIKHRFTDFLVFEVGLDGETVRLKDIEGPIKAPKAPKIEAVVGGSGDAAVPTWDESCETAMTPLLSVEKLLELKDFVVAGPAAIVKKGRGAPPVEGEAVVEIVPEVRAFKTDVIEAKEARTAFHRAIRETFAGKLSTEAKFEEDGTQYIRIVWSLKSERKHQPRADRSTAKAEAGDSKFIHFTLQKTNKEMHDSLAGLCRALHLTARDVGTAGTKDKRAVTVQRVSMKKGNKTVEDVWRALKGNPNAARGRGRGGRGGGNQGGFGNDRGVRIGDVAYGDIMFELGMLKGNKFVITLRDVKVDSPETITRAMETLKTQGFINYFGMQRFGTAPVPTHVVGLALLRSDWALAAHLLLRPRDGESDEVALPRLVLLEGNADEALRLIPRRAVAERAIIEHYAAQGQQDHLSAINRIPKNLRMMYVHSYQSYVWNRVVSERVRLYGCDKPVVGDLVYSDPTTAGDGEVEVKLDLPKVETLEADLEDDDEPIAAGPKLVSKIPAVQALTQADIDAGTYTMADVILPLAGFSIVYPTGPLGDLYRDIMKSDKLDSSDLYRRQKEFSLGGAYRKIMHKPNDVSHRLIIYNSTAQDLAQSDEDILLNRPAPPVTPYDPTIPLPLGFSLALQLELTLGSSTYATMALREVLKDKTSSTHQSTLTNAMEERAKIEGAKLEALSDLEKMETEEVEVGADVVVVV